MTLMPLATLVLLAGCPSGDPLHNADARYVEILARYHTADRDLARNVRNRDARRRMKDAEADLVAFFQDPDLTAAVTEARQATEGSSLRVRGDAWWREIVFRRSWTPEEKERESDLLARVDAQAAVEATWSPPNSSRRVPLAGYWEEVSEAADDLPAPVRADLAATFLDAHMALVGEDLQELVRLRNRIARREHYPSYWEFALYHEGLEPRDVDTLLSELKPVVCPVNEATEAIEATEATRLGLPHDWVHSPFLRRSSGLQSGREEAEAWFDADHAEDRILTSLREMGIDLAGWQVYIEPARYARKGAYSFPIRPPERIAFVMAADRRYDLWQYEALVHEAAHAFRWRTLVPEALASPVLWDPPNAYSEGFAQIFDRILLSPAWVARYIPDLPADVRDALATWRFRSMARDITEAIVDTLVERRVYADPDDLDALVRACQEIGAEWHFGSPGATRTGAPWCEALATPLIWHYPAYVQNFVFSYVTEAQLYEALVTAVGEPVGNPSTGPWLKALVKDGGTTPLADRIAEVAPDPDRTAALRRYLQVPEATPPRSRL